MALHHDGHKLSAHEQRAFDDIVRHLVMEEAQKARPEGQRRRGWVPWRRRSGPESEPQPREGDR